MTMAHRSKVSLAAAFSLVVCLLAPPLQAPASAQRPLDFEGIVDLFASGNETEALALVASWSKSEIRAHVIKLSRAEGAARRCLRCPGSLELSNSQLRAALLLHARREIQENLLLPEGEQVIRCDTGLHAQALEHLSAILLLVDSKAGDFLRPLYLAMSRQALWSHCLVESRTWAQAGLKLFPNEGALIMSVGIASETEVLFTPVPAPPTPGLRPSIVQQRHTEAMKLRSVLDRARGDYAAAVAANPGLFQARLRLGRVLSHLGQPEKARAHFEAVITTATDDLRYLAHLFLGSDLEDSGQWAEAESQYRAALSLQPRSERAAVALSHARFLQGDIVSAREILAASLEAARLLARADHLVDPWVSYLIIQTPEGEQILKDLGRSLRR